MCVCVCVCVCVCLLRHVEFWNHLSLITFLVYIPYI